MRKAPKHLMVDLRAVIRGQNSERWNTTALLVDAAGVAGHVRPVDKPGRVTTRGAKTGETVVDTGRIVVVTDLSPREWIASVKRAVGGNGGVVHIYAHAQRLGPSTTWIKWPEGSIG